MSEQAVNGVNGMVNSRNQQAKRAGSGLAGRASAHTATIGILEWFRPGEEARVERVLTDMRAIGIQELRTGVSWADWHTPAGHDWYAWLLPRLAAEVNVLPCFNYTPPSLGIAPKSSSPPREPKRYADFIDYMITHFGDCFDMVELWNEPNNMSEWDWTLDAHWEIFAQMVGGAANWARHRGKTTVLGGMSPFDPAWLHLMFERGVMQFIDVIGIHGFPGVWEQHWPGWDKQVALVQQILDEYSSTARIWITETGFSTWQHDQHEQLRRFIKAIEAPVDRIYWYAMEDLHSNLPTVDGFHKDEREYHFGLVHQDGAPKLLYRLWTQSGLEQIHQLHEQTADDIARYQTVSTHGAKEQHLLITGGAGFVGTNLADHFLAQGERVLIYDNLSRAGVEQNLTWLRNRYGNQLLIDIADVRNPYRLNAAVEQATAVFHLAAQVAVTTSLVDPIHDFAVNARGTLNLLEAVRTQARKIPLIFTSTNKVYGDLQGVDLTEQHNRYSPSDERIRQYGISEAQPLDFHSPYGASKGAADQYVLDYARTYGLSATVFRMSCIYGPHQFGTEDQGWVAHFLIRALQNQAITIYGDGKQVRDILFVTDLVHAFAKARQQIDQVAGQAFNVGGGPENAISLRELLALIENLHGQRPVTDYAETRTGDQRYYVSDTSRLHQTLHWQPSVGVHDGMKHLYQWLTANPEKRASLTLHQQAPAPTSNGIMNQLRSQQQRTQEQPSVATLAD